MARRVRRIEFWSRVSTEMQDFETFVMRGPAEIERLRTPQVDYLRADGKQADFIGRTEHLEADGHASRPSSESGSRAAQA